jgi:hypothetical protein
MVRVTGPYEKDSGLGNSSLILNRGVCRSIEIHPFLVKLFADKVSGPDRR